MDHFDQLKEGITEVVITKHFKRDSHDFDVSTIIDSDHEGFTHLHKYEENISGSHVFRALKDGTHYVYAIDRGHRLIFLRAFSNFREYCKFLDDKKAIEKMIEQV